MTEMNRYRPMAQGREGDFPGDRRGPREREAAAPKPPPLICKGCGHSSENGSHPIDNCELAHQWRRFLDPEPDPEPPSPGQQLVGGGVVRVVDVGSHSTMRLNGYRWPESLKKVNGSG